jgi:LmbE family N-acetylglucosaminyl deacetylase
VNVLVLAPHPDDETIGCGGSIRTHVESGDRVHVVFLTSGELGLKHSPVSVAHETRESEAKKASQILGFSIHSFLRLPDYGLAEANGQLTKAMVPILRETAPAQIYLPHPNEDHPDHAATLPALQAALREAGLMEPWLLGYEVWTPLSQFDHVNDVSAVWSRKIEGVRAYASQLAAFNYDRAITGLNQYRGALASHCEFAEVFATLDQHG